MEGEVEGVEFGEFFDGVYGVEMIVCWVVEWVGVVVVDCLEVEGEFVGGGGSEGGYRGFVFSSVGESCFDCWE